VNRRRKQHIQLTSNFSFTGDPGMPFLYSSVTEQTYGHVMNRISFRLSSWKAKLLNSACRITLARSTPLGVPFHSTQTVCIVPESSTV